MNSNTYEPTFRKTIIAYFLQRVISTSDIEVYGTSYRQGISDFVRTTIPFIAHEKASLINRNVLFFMNDIYQNHNNELNLLHLFNNDTVKISQCRKHLLTTSYIALVAFLDAEHTSIFSLLLSLLNLFLADHDMRELWALSLTKTQLIQKLKQWNWNENDAIEALCKVAGRDKATRELAEGLLDSFIFDYISTGYGTKKIIQSVLFYQSDIEIIRLLLYMFGKPWSLDCKLTQLREDISSNLGDFSSDAVLGVIDVRTAKTTFSRLKLEPRNCLKYLDHVETLKILIALCSDVREYNSWKFNYQHFFACYGKPHLLGYLIQTGGYDMNERTVKGNTPLHVLSDKQPVEITRLLVEHDVDVYAVNKRQENILHILFQFGLSIKPDVMCEWVTYILGKDYGKLFRMLNYVGETPLRVLSRVVGKTHPTRKAIADLLHFYPMDSVDESNLCFDTCDSEMIISSDESDYRSVDS